MNITLSEQQAIYARAVSICSIVHDLGLMRASMEDVIEGLQERHDMTIPPEGYQQVADAILAGMIHLDMFKPLDVDTFTLTAQGRAIGRDWSARIHKELNA